MSYDDYYENERVSNINSCYCTNHSICTICAKGYSNNYYRDPVVDYMNTRMADAEMGDL